MDFFSKGRSARKTLAGACAMILCMAHGCWVFIFLNESSNAAPSAARK
jgi:hypothetical protein